MLCSLSLLFVAGAVRGADETPSITRTEDVVYGRKYGMALTMDVFTPAKPNGAAIVLVVSGGWVSDKNSINPIFYAPMTNRGYTVFAVMHGCQPRFTIADVIEDMNRSIRFIRTNAKKYNIDPDRIGITGASAGGHLSLMIGMNGTEGDPKAKDPVLKASSRVQAVACLFPPTDFHNWSKEGHYLAPREFDARFNAAFDFQEWNKDKGLFQPITDDKKLKGIMSQISPITHVTRDDPPTLISHGDKDTLVPLYQSEIFIKKMKDTGCTCDLIVQKGAGHGGLAFVKDFDKFGDWFDKHLAKEKPKEGTKP